MMKLKQIQRLNSNPLAPLDEVGDSERCSSSLFTDKERQYIYEALANNPIIANHSDRNTTDPPDT